MNSWGAVQNSLTGFTENPAAFLVLTWLALLFTWGQKSQRAVYSSPACEFSRALEFTMVDCCPWWTSKGRRCWLFYPVLKMCVSWDKQPWRPTAPRMARGPGSPEQPSPFPLLPDAGSHGISTKMSHPGKESHNFWISGLRYPSIFHFGQFEVKIPVYQLLSSCSVLTLVLQNQKRDGQCSVLLEESN